MQEEVTQKTVTFVIRATKLTSNVLLSAIKAYMRAYDQKKAQKKQFKRNEKMQKKQAKKDLGKVKIKDLAAQNAGMTNIEITHKNIKGFERYARRYGINYALKQDKSKDPPVFMVFFKGRDQDAIHAAFRDFQNAELKKANRPSIRRRLQKYRDMTATAAKKIRQKHQEQSL